METGCVHLYTGDGKGLNTRWGEDIPMGSETGFAYCHAKWARFIGRAME